MYCLGAKVILKNKLTLKIGDGYKSPGIVLKRGAKGVIASMPTPDSYGVDFPITKDISVIFCVPCEHVAEYA